VCTARAGAVIGFPTNATPARTRPRRRGALALRGALA